MLRLSGNNAMLLSSLVCSFLQACTNATWDVGDQAGSLFSKVLPIVGKMMAEQTFFSEGGVKVTSARFIVPSQTYAMSGVTSVKALRRDPSRKGSIALIVLGVLAMLINLFIDVDVLVMLINFFIGLLLIGGAVVWWMVSKPLYAVVLSSASGEAEAFSSNDDTFISRVVNALNDAIVARG